MYPYVEGQDMTGIQVPDGVIPMVGGMIAVNTNDPKDSWYLSKSFMKANYKEVVTEESIEAEIQEKGLNAPRLTPDLIDSKIEYCEFFRVTNTTVTICAMILKNGYTVVGKSAAVSMENFDAPLGEKIARDDAREQIWALEGYLLKEKLCTEQ